MDIWVILVVILVLVLVWRGPKTLPQLGKAFGRGVREAREEAAKAQAEIQARTTTDDVDPDATPPATSPGATSPGTTSPDDTPPRPEGNPPSAT
jgi:Sec-independent protein translocase protein TatA